MKKLIFLVIPCLAFVTTLLSGCKESQISSVWNDKKVIIDGKGNEWQSGLKWNEKQKFGYSVANDSSNLYFYLTCTDRDLEKQIMMQGLSLTIQQKGSKGRLLGIKFPLAKSPMGGEMGEMGQMDQMGGRPSQRPDSMPGKQRGQQEELSSMMDDIQTEMIVLGPGKDDQRILPLVNKQGLAVKISRDRQKLGYEIQIPLKMIAQQLKTEPLSPKNPLKFTLKTEKAEKSMGRPEGEMGEGSQGGGGRGGFDGGEPPSDGGMMGGQGGGPGGGGPGGQGGMQGGPEGDSQSSFSFKFAVLLTTDK